MASVVHRQTENMRYENGVQFMDRCIGATSANRKTVQLTWGLVWQWGLSDSFFGGYAENEWNKEDALNEARSWTVVNSAYDFKWERKDEQVTMEEAIVSLYDSSSSLRSRGLLTGITRKTSPVEVHLRPTMTHVLLDIVCRQLRICSFWNNMEPSFKNGGYVYEHDGKKAWWPALGGGRVRLCL